MTAAPPYVDNTTRSPDPGASAVRSRWQTYALVAICALATALYAWRITTEGWGNPYYAAAVKSMSVNLTNFVFGSFDPIGVVTVDKPPLALWAMVLSTTIFGFHSWSVLLPQVIEGVAAVFLLHRTVRMWAGENAALIAALALAVTPITVAINRDSNPDTMMVLVLVAAAYAFTRSVRPDVSAGRSTRWLMLAAFLLGLGFLAKMLQGWIVVPAFALAYLVGSTAPLGKRALRLLGAGAVMIASSMWWVVLVGVWPQPKPYIGGSSDGSVMNLVLGYNGLGRVLGNSSANQLLGSSTAGNHARGGPGGAAQAAGHAGGQGGGFNFGSDAGITRMFSEAVGGQISWLLPLCVVVLVVAVVAGIRMTRTGQPSDPVRRAGWFLWGGWFVLVTGVLSFMQNMFHPYYTTEMAPGIAALTGVGVVMLWRYYRRPDGYGWLILPGVVVLTAAWAWLLISRDLNWNGWLRYAVAAVAVAAVVLLVVGRRSVTGSGSTGSIVAAGLPRVAGVLSVVALLLAPGVWSAATAFASSSFGAMAQAGPPSSQFGRMGGGHNRGRGPGGMPAMPGMSPAQQAEMRQLMQEVSRGQIPPQMRNMARGSLSPQQSKLLAYAQAHSGGARIALAVEGGAMSAESYILGSDATVIGMGGFSGGDPAPTVQQLAQWVNSGQLRFVAYAARDRGGPGQSGPGQSGPNQSGPGGNAHGNGMPGFGESGASQQRIQWVQQHCTVVAPSQYGGAEQQQSPIPFGPFGGNETLYECHPAH